MPSTPSPSGSLRERSGRGEQDEDEQEEGDEDEEMAEEVQDPYFVKLNAGGRRSREKEVPHIAKYLAEA